MLGLIIILIFITATFITYFILSYVLGENKSITRINKYVNHEYSFMQEEKSPREGIIKIVSTMGKKFGNLGIFTAYKKRVQSELNKAHVLLKGEEFISICMITMIGCILFFSIILRNIAMGLLFGLIGWNIPMMFVKRKKKKRIKLLNDQLGDAIVLVSNSLKAGYSFFQAIDTVSTEMSGSIAEEFGQVKKEINLGFTTEQALENLIKRVDSDDLELMVTAVLIQRQVGGNLAEILDNISGTIRDRVKILGEVKTLTAQGRMSGMIIAFLPPVMGALLFLINPQYIILLFNNTLGLIMVGISVLMELIGIFFISKIVKIEV